MTYEMVRAKNQQITEGSQELWAFVEFLLQEAARKGFFHSST